MNNDNNHTDNASMSAVDKPAWQRGEFETLLREKGELYHIHHPYHVAMNSGKSTKQQIQAWVANRYYYQINIPLKDAAIMANCSDQMVRRQWVKRILDHDGIDSDAGGIEAWLRLAEAVGLSRDQVISQQYVLPSVRFAVDAYVNFARGATWQEAAGSSLTELFAPVIHRQRLNHWPEFYPWIETQGYDYFRQRLGEVNRDLEHGLAITLDYCQTRQRQEKMLNILQFKLDILWTMLDAMQLAYVHAEPPYHNLTQGPYYVIGE